MIKIVDILDPKCIKLEMESTKKKDAIAELLNLLLNAGKIEASQAESLLKELLDREKVSSTGIGFGVAIPHKIVEKFDQTVMAFGRKKGGISFDAIDGKPVSLVFLVLGPGGNNTDHLKLLSKLARILQEPSFREALRNAETPGQILTEILIRENECA
ncbi:MAG: PTS sugar transporter subunit IIA [Spirochaetales bacterium]|nr:PTS sugar transporter subunit IIA [Spirochaetales bacterium]